MNHLVIPSEVQVNEEPANEDMNESVEADLEHSQVEEEQQPVICYSRHRNSNQEIPSGQEEEGMLARSASTESDFHNHMDMVEGDIIATAEDGYDVDIVQENEEETTYAVQYRPESEEYTENAEAEHTEAVRNRTLPDHVCFHSIEHEEVINAVYSGYVYTHQPLHQGEDERYAEPYVDYRQQEHVYEEIGDVLDLDVREGLQLYEWEREEADNYHKEALGARLHHYDERSDGESDSPEKEAEFAPYPRMDSYEQEEDIDQTVAEVKQSMSSQSLGKAAEDMLEAEQSLEHAHALPGRGHESNSQLSAGSRATAHSGESVQRCRKEKRDAVSLAIKDIKEAIEEVKTRTVRSPYTPDEPKEPIWVMRQDISPTRDCEEQRPLDGDSLSSDSSSPWDAEPSRQHHQDVCSTAETSTNKESRKSLALFPTYVEVPGPCDPEDLIDGIIFAANYLGSTQLLSDKTPSKNVRMMQAQEAVSRIKFLGLGIDIASKNIAHDSCMHNGPPVHLRDSMQSLLMTTTPYCQHVMTVLKELRPKIPKFWRQRPQQASRWLGGVDAAGTGHPAGTSAYLGTLASDRRQSPLYPASCGGRGEKQQHPPLRQEDKFLSVPNEPSDRARLTKACPG
ncbi:amyloid-beta A4 precursor protein-binding family A member 1-like [Chlamydotis macqueenii]